MMTPSPAAGRDRESQHSGRLRKFVENKGQWDERCRFKSSSDNIDMWFADKIIYYDYYTIVDHDSARKDNKLYEDVYDYFVSDSLERRGQVVSMEFVSERKSNNKRKMRSRFRNQTKMNYLERRNDKSTSLSADSYSELVDENVYEHVDLRYYFDQVHVRYDIEVDPGGDPDAITIRFNGADSLSLNSAGELLLHTSIGAMVHGDMLAYQPAADGRKDTVTSEFVLHGNNEVRFNVGTYDKKRKLIIDPIMTATYLGGAATELTVDTKLDASGNIYVVGSTESTSAFPTTTGAYQTVHNGAEDMTVTKFNSNGDQILWSTLIGGVNDDRAFEVEIHTTSGNVIVAGYAGAGFPQVNPVQASYGGGLNDGVILMLNPTGDALLFSSYIGTNDKDRMYDIVESNNPDELFFCGYAFGSNLATTSGVFQPNKGGGNRDAFIGKLSLDPLGISYMSYIGGNDNDHLYEIAALSGGRVAACGFTKSTSGYPTTTNAHQQVFGGGDYDAVLSIVADGAASLEYSTLIGGNGDDRAHAIYVNNNEEIYLTGHTGTSTFPTSLTAFDDTYNGGTDAFITKFSTQGTITHSTFFGAGDVQAGWGILRGNSGGILVVGNTFSTAVPQVGEELDNVNNGSMDVFVAEFDSELKYLTRSSIFGGSNDDSGLSVVVDSFGRIIIVGTTNSTDFPTTNALDSVLN